jgi:hypothetical protein
MSQLIEISNRFKELQEKYKKYLPKVDPALINDLLLRQMENPSVTPLYMVEIFTKPGTNPERSRAIIREKTGMNPAIYDNSNHFVITQKLTIEKLKGISEFNEVLEITGKYIGGLGGGYGTSHELTHMNENKKKGPLATSTTTSPAAVAAEQSSLQSVVQVQRNQEKDVRQYPKSQRKQQQKQKSKYQVAIFTAIGIVGVIALTGFIISGGILPNVNQNNASPATQTTSTTDAVLPPGVLYGYVAGPTGLPAVGASVIAANQETGYTENAIISINGQYFLNNLPTGEYIIMVAYPDGTNKVVNDFQIESGSSHKLDFSY